MNKVKIEVVRITEYKDLSEKYEIPQKFPCILKLGDVFISENGEIPPNFCKEARKSIEPFAKDLAAGKGNFYGERMKDPYSACISCNDGFRPVSFFLTIIS